MSNLQSLYDNQVWYWFEQICNIPHPSFHEEKLKEFVVDFARQRNLEYFCDEAGNVLIKKPANGKKNAPTVALQAHMDMVPQANAGFEHNFLTDPIKPYIENGWVKATNTTLGADNGIGLASCLAVLDSKDLAHPDLEVLITSNEEVGMIGVTQVSKDWLSAKYLINTDTDREGHIYIGCAGGVDVEIDMPLTKQIIAGEVLEVKVSGLQGGHSGCSIHKNLANAIKLLSQVLNFINLQGVAFNIIEINGGTAHNAIPREATAIIATSDPTNFQNKALEFIKNLQQALVNAKLNQI